MALATFDAMDMDRLRLCWFGRQRQLVSIQPLECQQHAQRTVLQRGIPGLMIPMQLRSADVVSRRYHLRLWWTGAATAEARGFMLSRQGKGDGSSSALMYLSDIWSLNTSVSPLQWTWEYPDPAIGFPWNLTKNYVAGIPGGSRLPLQA